MIIFDNINIEKLNLVEHLPQVGSRVYRYTFENGLFVLDKNIKTPIDYIINDNGEFLLGKGHYKLNNQRETLFSAGRVIIDDKITYIDNDSGHYNPGFDHTEKVAEFLRSQGVTSDKMKVVNIRSLT
jgi:hypothetical protein